MADTQYSAARAIDSPNDSGDFLAMDFFQAVEQRRSIRKFGDEPVPPAAIQRALEMAVLAPNSSNAQTWDFYWAHSPEIKKNLAEACLNQSAAVTASDLVVVAANRKRWRRSIDRLVEFNKKVDAPRSVQAYYTDIVPRVYRHRFFNLHLPFKKIIFATIGFFRPVPRRPLSGRDVEELCVKSAALGAENFALAMTAQGYGTCMMEGFDERRVQKYLNLTRSDRIAMVIAVGTISQEGKWGPRFRLPSEEVIHRL